MLFNRTKMDTLSSVKKDLLLKRDKLLRDMRARNSKRETKISLLENASQTDYENTNKKVIEINRRLDKCIRDIDSEQQYVNEVADAEKNEYIKDKKNEQVRPKGVK